MKVFSSRKLIGPRPITDIDPLIQDGRRKGCNQNNKEMERMVEKYGGNDGTGTDIAQSCCSCTYACQSACYGQSYSVYSNNAMSLGSNAMFAYG